jgi:hypothetical protein
LSTPTQVVLGGEAEDRRKGGLEMHEVGAAETESNAKFPRELIIFRIISYTEQDHVARGFNKGLLNHLKYQNTHGVQVLEESFYRLTHYTCLFPVGPGMPSLF